MPDGKLIVYLVIDAGNIGPYWSFCIHNFKATVYGAIVSEVMVAAPTFEDSNAVAQMTI